MPLIASATRSAENDFPVGGVILETRALTRNFGGFTAVDQVDLKVVRGSIHALIGPNGAGKTTCFNLLTKFLPPSAGQILYKGVDITRLRPADVATQGLVRSFQISAVFPHFSALGNVRLALQRKQGWHLLLWMSAARSRFLDEKAAALLESVGLANHLAVVAADLSYGRKRALELATTLALDPQLMLLDEPLAGMGHEDIDMVTDLTRAMAVDRTILMVEHNLDVVSRLCDEITVLRRGQVIANGDYAFVSKNPEVISAYLGGGDL